MVLRTSLIKKRVAPFFAIVSIFFASCSLLQAQLPLLSYQDLANLEDYSFFQSKCTFQDSRGLIWIGTMMGLNRWDGNRLTRYPDIFIDSVRLRETWITSIAEDNNNNLWIACMGKGLVKYDLEHEKFTLEYYPDDSTFNVIISDIHYDPKGFFWLRTYRKLYKYYPKMERITQVPYEDIDENTIDVGSRDMAFDSTGVLWITNKNGLYYYDPKKEILKLQQFKRLEFDLEGVLYNRISIDRYGNFWMLGDRSELVKFNPYSKRIELVRSRKDRSALPTTIGGIQVDKQGKVWFGMTEGLLCHDPVTGETTTFVPNETPFLIQDILMDSNGNLLISTYDGVKIIDRTDLKIRT